MKSRFPLLLTAAAIALGAMSDGARAGAKYFYPVYVNKAADGTGTLTGSLSSTRNSAGTTSSFSCFYEAFPPSWGGGFYASCHGNDGVNTIYCGTTDPAIANTISRIASDSYVWVQIASPGTCTRVQIGHQSQAEPKAP